VIEEIAFRGVYMTEERRGRGRPKGSTKGQRPRRSVVLDHEFDQKVLRLAEIDNRTISQVLHMCVRYSIDRMLKFQSARGDLLAEMKRLAEFLNEEIDPESLDLVGQMNLFDVLSEQLEETTHIVD
jgi:hypothetical protein